MLKDCVLNIEAKREGRVANYIYSSTFFLILSSESSCFKLRLLFSQVVSSSTGVSVALLFFPETSSAISSLSAAVPVIAI